jgi:hypothetical protein
MGRRTQIIDMRLTKKTERFDAILSLQNKQKKHPRGSYLHDIYEKATDLALNPEREVNSYFQRNLIRDAKRILGRQTKSSIFRYLTEFELQNDDLVIDLNSPYELIVYDEYFKQIEAHCKLLQPDACNVLQCLVEGKKVTEISKELKISESKVKLLRVKIKAMVRSIILN